MKKIFDKTGKFLSIQKGIYVFSIDWGHLSMSIDRQKKILKQILSLPILIEVLVAVLITDYSEWTKSKTGQPFNG